MTFTINTTQGEIECRSKRGAINQGVGELGADDNGEERLSGSRRWRDNVFGGDFERESRFKE